MSAIPTPAWGTPTGSVGTGTGANTAAETQLMPSVQQVPPRPVGPSRGEVELRVTALHYANRLMGERGTTNPDTHTSDTLRAAKQLERYLLTGDVNAI